MNLTSSTKDGAIVIAVNEENLDIGNSVEFREALGKEAEGKTGNIILDFTNVKYIDSSGLGVLITFLRFIKDGDRTLKLANCNKKVKDTFKSTKLDTEIPLFDSIEAAL